MVLICLEIFVLTESDYERSGWQKGPWHQPKSLTKRKGGGFPGGAVVENLPANAGDTGSSPGLGGSHMPRSN